MPDKTTPNESITDKAPSDAQEVRELYDGFSSQYDQAVSKWGYTAPEVAASYLVETVSLNEAVLDAGCGTGLTGAALHQKGYRQVIGSDLSPDSVNIAEQSGFYDHVHTLDLNDPLPFESEQFGGVVCVGVLSYIPDPEPALKEFLRVLKRGGTLVFTQREDHFKRYNSASLFERLHASGAFDRIEQTNPKPYLPHNPSFADTIGVHYMVWQKHR